MNNVSRQLLPHLPLSSRAAKGAGFVFHEDEYAAPHIAGEVEGYHYVEPHDMVSLPHDVPLHTTQKSVDKAGVRHYIDSGYDPEEYREAEGYNAPQVYKHENRVWVAEGHHRLMADRLTGRESTVQYIDYDNYDRTKDSWGR